MVEALRLSFQVGGEGVELPHYRGGATLPRQRLPQQLTVIPKPAQILTRQDRAFDDVEATLFTVINDAARFPLSTPEM